MITKNLVDINNPTWQERAACKDVDPKIFFELKYRKEAKAICLSCPVLQQCREWTLRLEKGGGSMERTGFYAGMTSQERFKLFLCKKPDCINERPDPKEGYCSPEHRAQDKKDKYKKQKEQQRKKNYALNPYVANEDSYYMKGTIRSA